MKLYEYPAELETLIDLETGEITDPEAFNALQLEYEDKVEGLALWVKDLTAEAAAIQNEIKTLQQRQKAAEHKADSLREYLTRVLGGEKFKTARVAISYRTTQAVEIEDDGAVIEWACKSGKDDEYLRYPDPQINKNAVREALKAGEHIPDARLVSHTSTIIK